MFDWQRFLDAQHIEYVTSGASVTRGNVAIRCPWCTDDPSHHMGISLNGAGWGCWRNAEHRGKSPVKLVAALLHCSTGQAMDIVGIDRKSIPNDFFGRVQALMSPQEDAPMKRRQELHLYPEFLSFGENKPSARPYVQYLRGRDFTVADIASLTRRYGVRYCSRGPWQGRIIFGVRQDGELQTWTGRSISKTAELRYKTLTDDPEKAKAHGEKLPAVKPVNHCLLFFDSLCQYGGKHLLITEGPFDALKVNVLGWHSGIRATCLFTNNPTVEQIELLHVLAPKFEHRHLVLDRGMFARIVKLSSALASLNLSMTLLPAFLKDPGELRSLAELRSIVLPMQVS